LSDLRILVARNRSGWERLEILLGRIRRGGLRSLTPTELRDLGLLHRKVSSDLAAARSLHADSRLVRYLNDLALRSHNAVYRAPRRGVVRTLADLRTSIPRTVRRHRGALAAASILFLGATLLGAVGVALDESVATLVLDDEFVDSIRRGEYLGRSMFGVMPQSVTSAAYLTNNTTVALNTFAFGVTGIVPVYLMMLNGSILGIVGVMCGRYGIFTRFVGFVTPHGIIEISAILLAGAGAFTTFDGWLHPGDDSRLEGLRRGAREGLTIMGGALPALLVAAFVEGFISPQAAIPVPLRIALGTALGILLWAWLLGVGREPVPAAAGLDAGASTDARDA
jgi:uncharacterized membrane protein SpoIIM required for sporulation